MNSPPPTKPSDPFAMRHPIELRCTVLMTRYVMRLIEMEGFGDTEQEVIERLVWDRFNELIVAGRLPRPSPPPRSSASQMEISTMNGNEAWPIFVGADLKWIVIGDRQDAWNKTHELEAMSADVWVGDPVAYSESDGNRRER